MIRCFSMQGRLCCDFVTTVFLFQESTVTARRVFLHAANSYTFLLLPNQPIRTEYL
jgi:hypothetical protein